MYAISQVKCAWLEPGPTKRYKLTAHKAMRDLLGSYNQYFLTH